MSEAATGTFDPKTYTFTVTNTNTVARANGTAQENVEALERNVDRWRSQNLMGWTMGMLEAAAEAGRAGEIRFVTYFAVLDEIKRRSEKASANATAP